jgi:hypothetical protein
VFLRQWGFSPTNLTKCISREGLSGFYAARSVRKNDFHVRKRTATRAKVVRKYLRNPLWLAWRVAPTYVATGRALNQMMQLRKATFARL